MTYFSFRDIRHMFNKATEFPAYVASLDPKCLSSFKIGKPSTSDSYGEFSAFGLNFVLDYPNKFTETAFYTILYAALLHTCSSEEARKLINDFTEFNLNFEIIEEMQKVVEPLEEDKYALALELYKNYCDVIGEDSEDCEFVNKILLFKGTIPDTDFTKSAFAGMKALKEVVATSESFEDTLRGYLTEKNENLHPLNHRFQFALSEIAKTMPSTYIKEETKVTLFEKAITDAYIKNKRLRECIRRDLQTFRNI